MRALERATHRRRRANPLLGGRAAARAIAGNDLGLERTATGLRLSYEAALSRLLDA